MSDATLDATRPRMFQNTAIASMHDMIPTRHHPTASLIQSTWATPANPRRIHRFRVFLFRVFLFHVFLFHVFLFHVFLF